MKKFLTGVVALMIALSAVAFPKMMNKDVDYFWYKRTGVDTYVSNGHGPDPNVSCSGSGNICAKGFLNSQTAGDIRDNTMANDERVKN